MELECRTWPQNPGTFRPDVPRSVRSNSLVRPGLKAAAARLRTFACFPRSAAVRGSIWTARTHVPLHGHRQLQTSPVLEEDSKGRHRARARFWRLGATWAVCWQIRAAFALVQPGRAAKLIRCRISHSRRLIYQTFWRDFRFASNRPAFPRSEIWR